MQPEEHGRPTGYEYLKFCGSGAYGVTWLVRDLSQRLMVLKQIQKSELSEIELNGVRNFCRLPGAHPNLIRIYHVGEDNDCLFYTMTPADNLNESLEDYLPATLENLLRRKKISSQEIRRIILAILDSLDYLHQAGLVHRDVKPGNILMVDNIPCLGDIGLVCGGNSPASMRGTSGFLPPERFREDYGIPEQEEFHQEYDFYALGKVMYCMLSGLSVDNFPMLRPDNDDADRATLNRICLTLCDNNPAWRLTSITEIRQKLSGNEPLSDSLECIDNQAYSKVSPRGRKWALGILLLGCGASIAFYISVSNSFVDSTPPAILTTSSRNAFSPAIPQTSDASVQVEATTMLASAGTDTVATLSANASPEAQSLEKKWAVALRRLDCAQMTEALRQGICPDRATAGFSLPPLLYCIVRRAPLEIIKLLLQYGAPLYYSEPKETALQMAIICDCPLEVQELLIEADSNRDVPVGFGRTALFTAVSYGNIQVVRTLVARGCKVNRRDYAGQTPLYKALGHGHVELAKYLLEVGADPNLPDNDGAVALHAVIDLPSDLLQLLLKQNVNINAPKKDGMTPLQSGIRRNVPLETLQAFLAAGAQVNVPDHYGVTPLHDAVRNYRPDVMDLLLEHGASVKAVDRSGMTPLHYAAISDNLFALDRLVNAGAELSPCDRYGRTPLDFAILGERGATINWFRQHGAEPVFTAQGSGRVDFSGSMLDSQGRKILTWTGPISKDLPVDIAEREPHISQCCQSEELYTNVESGLILNVESLLSSQRLSANTPDFLWRYPLSAAIRFNDLEMVKLLLRYGANPTLESLTGETPLQEAVRRNVDLRVVQVLLDAGADPWIKGSAGASAFDLAENGQRDVLLQLFRFYCGLPESALR